MVKTVEVQGFPHAYELTAATDAPIVLVFVHGWLLSQAYWQPVVEQLAGDYQCLTYDLRGFGQSQPIAASPAVAEPLPSLTETVAETITEPMVEKTAVTVASPAARTIDYSQEISREVSAVSLPRTDASLAPSESASSTTEAGTIQSYTPAAYAQDLIHLLEKLNLKKVWVVGHSLGGSIALWAAHLAPETIEGVICINSGGGIYLKEEFEQFRRAGEKLVQFRPRWLSYIPFLDLMLTRMNVHRPIDRLWGKQRLQDLLTADAAAALGSLLDSTTEAEVHQLPQVVSQISQPVHFIAGQIGRAHV